MKMIRILPTDKFGKVYYGPKTFAEGEKQIKELNDDHWMSPRVVVDMMREAGYVVVANRLAKKYLD
jgi:hypothetical protein